MSLRCCYLNLPPLVRGLTIAACLAAHLALSIGFPLAQPRQQHARPSAGATAERFPCEHHRCGCVSAEQCWRSCCCHSLDERLAWAERHDVDPPVYVRQLLALRAASRERPDRVESGAACQHCAAAPANDDDPIAASCCEQIEIATQPIDQDVAPRPSRWVLGFQALKCQGLSLSWVSTGVVLPTPTAGVLERDQTVAPWFPSRVTRLASRALAPETPPPRRLAV